MPDAATLRASSAALLGVPVEQACLVTLDIGRAAPAGAGVAGAAGADAAVSLLGLDSPLVDGVAAGAGYVAGKHAAYDGAASAAGVTPVMVLAVTADTAALLDWNGNVRSGTGPTRVLAQFARAGVTGTRSGSMRHLVLREGQREARVQVTLGLLAPGKANLRAVLGALGIE